MNYVVLKGGRISRMEDGVVRKYVENDLIDLSDDEAKKYRHMIAKAPSQPSRIQVRRLRNPDNDDLHMRHVVDPNKDKR